MKDTDVYSALSWDRLHAYHAGLFSDHLLDELKSLLEVLPGRQTEAAIDRACVLYLAMSVLTVLSTNDIFTGSLDKIPPWSGLNHFHLLRATGEFSDGTKFEDLSKV